MRGAKKFSLFKDLHLGFQVGIFFVVFSGMYTALRIFLWPPSGNELSYTNNNFNFLGLKIPANLHFCGEKIPPNNYEIIKNLEKEFFSNAYWKANSSVLFAKAQKWFPYIEPILKREGVPEDFKYVAFIESHLSNIISPAGAAGFWQLVPVSARHFGLEVNEYIDERFHVEKATVVACRLFKQAYSEFNNWTLAAAAYNRGIGGIQAALRNQNADNYYELMLNKETGSFVYRILAYKTLFSTPAHFGIKRKSWTYLPMVPFDYYKVDTSVHDIANLAKQLKCNKAMIKLFNPWILQEQIPNPERKSYVIRIPKNLKSDYSGYIKDLTGQDGDLKMDPEQAPQPSDAPTTDSSQVMKSILHVVKEHESLKELANFYEVPEEQIRKWNNLKEGQDAVAGQTLSIPFLKK